MMVAVSLAPTGVGLRYCTAVLAFQRRMRGSSGGLDGLQDDAGHDRRLGDEGQVPGLDDGDVGAGTLGHERLVRGRDDVVRRPDHGPGRDGLPGRGPNVEASALAASGRWVAAMTAAWLAGRPLAKHPGTTLGLR